MLWNLRRIDDLIELINNIVDVEQDEIDDKNIEFEEFEILTCIKNLRRVKSLIDWNWDSSVEFKLIAKIFVLNELNSLLNLRRSRFLIDQLTELREDIFICMWLKFFSDFLSFLSSKYDFLAVSRRSRRIYFSRALKWCFWMYEEKCYCMMWKTSFRKIFEQRIKN